VAERYDLTPRLATNDPASLDAFVDAWAQASDNNDERMLKAKNALCEEFDLERLSARFQAAFA